MNTPQNIQYTTEVDIFGRIFEFRTYSNSNSLMVYCVGTVGHRIAFEVDVNTTRGSIKIKPKGNWRFTIPQYREIYSIIFDLVESGGNHELVQKLS